MLGDSLIASDVHRETVVFKVCGRFLIASAPKRLTSAAAIGDEVQVGEHTQRQLVSAAHVSPAILDDARCVLFLTAWLSGYADKFAAVRAQVRGAPVAIDACGGLFFYRGCDSVVPDVSALGLFAV